MATKLFSNAVLAIIGFILSAYSVYVEHRIEHKDESPDGGEEFQALCDIEAIGASCSAVFSLPEGKMLSFFGLVPKGHAFDIPNGVLGMLFYTYVFLRSVDKYPRGMSILFTSTFNLIISSLAISSSIFLGRKLYIIQELCIVCVSTHIINTTAWIRAIREAFGSSQKTEKIH